MTITDPTGAQASVSNGTGDSFLAWFDYLIKRKEMPEATASSLRTGVRKVLNVEEDAASIDIRTFDVDDIVRRYRNDVKGDISQASVNEYERRFRQSVDMYRKWLGDDPDWLPRGRRASGSTTKRAAASENHKARSAAPAQAQVTTVAGAEVAGMTTYPFPVRPGVQAQITLPDDLTEREAKRVATFVAALAFTEPKGITAGPPTEALD